MTTTKPKPHRRPAARHPTHRRQGLRNAAPRPPTSRTPRAAADGQQRDPTMFERIGYTAAGAGLASLGGALATRWGFHPRTVAIILGAAGGAALARLKDKEWQAAGAGAFSAGGSQLLLMLLKGSEQSATQVASKDSQPAKEPPRRQLGTLPPGALDAAFERARSTLAMDAEGHEYAYGHPGY